VTGRFRALISCARAPWRPKAALSVALIVCFCAPYFALQHVALSPPRRLPLSAIDRAIGFDPRWIWAYQSVYLLVTAVPWILLNASDLPRYARGFLQISGLGFAFFLLLPVRGPRPEVEAANFMFRLMQWYDRPLNCMPSLHAALSVYTVLFAGDATRGRMTPSARRFLLSAGWFWILLIAYAAVATKQHYAIDLPAGALLAGACYWWTCHYTQRSMPHVERPIAHRRLARDPVDASFRDRDRYAPDGTAGAPGVRR
jgi:membrane-associated phospholipid phosphatase